MGNIKLYAIAALAGIILMGAVYGAGYKAGAEDERNRCDADRTQAIEEALERRETLEAMGRGVSRGLHERAAERETRAEELREEVASSEVDNPDRQCFSDNGVRELNEAVRRIQ